ncbi:hypothetical protein ABK040_013311 [Willaertia magna]
MQAHRDHFPREILIRVIADICSHLGFHGMKSSACDVLVDVLQSYIQKIAETSIIYSNHCNRTQVNVFDVEKSLFHHLNLSLKEIILWFEILQEKQLATIQTATTTTIEQQQQQYNDKSLQQQQEQFINLSTFEFDIPEIPKMNPSSLMSCPQTHFHLLMNHSNKLNKLNSVNNNNEEDEEQELFLKEFEMIKPKFLPNFPPKHTFRFTPVMNKKLNNLHKIQLEKTRQRRQIEDSLNRLHEAELLNTSTTALVGNGGTGTAINNNTSNSTALALASTSDTLGVVGSGANKEEGNIANSTITAGVTSSNNTTKEVMKTKKRTIVQKNDIHLINLEKQMMMNKEIPEEERINPYLQIEKQRVSLAVQRNVHANQHQLTMAGISNGSKKKDVTANNKDLGSNGAANGGLLKKPFISIITRDDSTETQLVEEPLTKKMKPVVNTSNL